MSSKFVKILGFIGALATGASLIVAGDFAQGVGIIAAALSSATMFSGPT
jgi:hypothetical protein